MDSSNSSSNYYSHPAISFAENDSSPMTFLFNNFPNSPNTHLEEYEAAYIHCLYNLHFLQDNSNHFTPNFPTNNMTTTSTLDNNSSSNIQTEENPPVVLPKTRPPSSKKDRHSKINTAQGPRDRRMRLSLDVARKFFDLQDMLGYDKASRTVDWLMRSSWGAIKDFKRGITGNNSGSSISEEEVVSSEGLEDIISGSSSENLKKPDQSGACQKKNSNKKGGKAVIARTTVEKESRRKARERARDRTSQKKRLGFSADVEMIPNCTENNIQFQDEDGQIRRILRPVLVDGMENSSIFYAQNDGIFQPQQHLGEFQFCSKQWGY